MSKILILLIPIILMILLPLGGLAMFICGILSIESIGVIQNVDLWASILMIVFGALIGVIPLLRNLLTK